MYVRMMYVCIYACMYAMLSHVMVTELYVCELACRKSTKWTHRESRKAAKTDTTT